MEDSFQKIKNEGHNTVDNLVKWMKDSKIVENSKAGEEKARKLFDNVKDKSNVELEHFKGAIAKLAEEQKKTVEELGKKLNKEGPKLLNALKEGATTALSAGVSAFKDAMNK